MTGIKGTAYKGHSGRQNETKYQEEKVNMKSMKRKGFTLVELLIVIVVIGILSSMMMMSSTEAVTSAKASNIVANLRNLKTAALAFYIDSLDAISQYPNASPAGSKDKIFKYLGSTNIPDSKDYGFGKDGGGCWYVSYDIDNAKGISGAEKALIKQKLAGRASSVGLCNGNSPSSKDVYKSTNSTAAMFIR